MKTAAEILHKVTEERTGTAYSNSVILEAMKLYASEKVKEALKLAAERGRVLYTPDVGTHNSSHLKINGSAGVYTVDRELILSLETEILEQINKEG